MVQTLLGPIVPLADKFKLSRLRKNTLEHRLCSKVGSSFPSTLELFAGIWLLGGDADALLRSGIPLNRIEGSSIALESV